MVLSPALFKSILLSWHEPWNTATRCQIYMRSWSAISRRRGPYHSVDHAQFLKHKAHNTVANPELCDWNIQKAFITVRIVQSRISGLSAMLSHMSIARFLKTSFAISLSRTSLRCELIYVILRRKLYYSWIIAVPMSLLRYSGFCGKIISNCHLRPAHNKYCPDPRSLFLRCV
jgi:hypothetical protein